MNMMAVRLLRRWLAALCLLPAGLTAAAAEFRTPSITAVRVEAFSIAGLEQQGDLRGVQRVDHAVTEHYALRPHLILVMRRKVDQVVLHRHPEMDAHKEEDDGKYRRPVR